MQHHSCGKKNDIIGLLGLKKLIFLTIKDVPGRMYADRKESLLNLILIIITSPVAQCIMRGGPICSNACGGWFMPGAHSVRMT